MNIATHYMQSIVPYDYDKQNKIIAAVFIYVYLYGNGIYSQRYNCVYFTTHKIKFRM